MHDETTTARGIRFADLTTLQVGGPVTALRRATTQRDLADLATAVWADRGPWMALGGGSNLLVGDEGFDGTVIQVATRGIEVLPGAPPGSVRIRVQAGESWDGLVAWTVERGYSGFEALSGIPGSVGASPMQNIGAYGQEVADTLVAIEFLDEGAARPRRMTVDELDLGYRTSVLKQGLAGIVVSAEFELHDTSAERNVLGGALGLPIAYRQLADALHVQVGDRMPVGRVREAVLALRASKGMVIDPDDPDSVSAGSFFTNPIVTERISRALPSDAPRWYVEPDEPDEITPLSDLAGLDASPLESFLQHQASIDAAEAISDAAPGEPLVKLSAAWLIERSGIRRGFALPSSAAAVSSKHTLALINRGGATADDIAQLARFIMSRVQSEFGIVLRPEPVFVGVEL